MLVLFIIFPRGPIFCPTLYPRPLRGSEALVKEASEPHKGPGYELVFCQEELGPLLATSLIVSCLKHSKKLSTLKCFMHINYFPFFILFNLPSKGGSVGERLDVGEPA